MPNKKHTRTYKEIAELNQSMIMDETMFICGV